ncbi:MAG: hypothetical protein ACK4RK_15405 [Gemmataceae bacterium]
MLLAGLSGGCGGDTFVQVEGLKVQTDHFQIELGSDAQGNPVRVASDLLVGVPLYPGAVIQHSYSNPNSFLLSLSAAATPAQVGAYYQKNLSANSWSVQGSFDARAGGIASATRDDRQCLVNITPAGKKTDILLSVNRPR